MGITDVFKTKHFKNDIERLTAENIPAVIVMN